MSPVARADVSPTSPVEPAKVVANILAQGLHLPAGRVMLDYERWEIPKDGLFVVVGYLGPGEQIAAQSFFDPVAQTEVQELYNKLELQIDLMSIIPDNAARLRRWEVPMALQSFYARHYAAGFGVGLAPLQGAMTDTSALEPGGYLNRFTLRAPVFAVEKRVLPTGYFDAFAAALTTATPNAPAPAPRNIPLEAP